MISLRSNAIAWNLGAHPTINTDNGNVISYLECFEMCTGLNATPSAFDSIATNPSAAPFVTPTTICAPCLHELRISYTFRQRCWQNDRYLREQWNLAAKANVCNDKDATTQSGNPNQDNFGVKAEAREGDVDDVVDDSTMWLIETVDDDEDEDDEIEADVVDNVTDEVVEYDDIEPTEQQRIDELDESAAFLDDVDDDDGSNITYLTTTRLEAVDESIHRNTLLPPNVTVFQCDYCGKDWHSKQSLLQHMRQDHVHCSDTIE